MRLIKFTATNYRSIASAQGIRLSDRTVLIGPNNEGKSNILQALVAAMQIVERGAYYWREGLMNPAVLARVILPQGSLYEWDRDYPKHLQDSSRSGRTMLRLEFELTARETADFRRSVGSSLNGTLPLELVLGDNFLDVKVRKQGPGGRALTAKADRIAAFVSRKIRVEHIKAVRTAAQAEAVAVKLVEQELRRVERDPEYQAALARIEALQRPILDRLSNSIRDTLVSFLPKVRRVHIKLPKEDRLGALRRCEVLVDDGTTTPLHRKGDGAQSLAALGIMRHQSDRDAEGRSLVLAIEEPESHLHPEAIHRLRTVIDELAQRHQVVITTHCPLYADRIDVASNILVQDRVARPAKTLEEVRSALGVRAADNLRSAQLVLLLEGECDRVALRALMAHKSRVLAAALRSGALGLTPMGGANRLHFFARAMKDSVCEVHAFLDSDAEGLAAAESAQQEGIIAVSEVTHAICPNLRESELEDLFDPAFYSNLADAYGVDDLGSRMTGSAKWSARMDRAFRSCGKVLSEDVKFDLKRKLAERVSADPARALHAAREGSLVALVRALERRIVPLA